jgi:hypothetical protein
MSPTGERISDVTAPMLAMKTHLAYVAGFELGRGDNPRPDRALPGRARDPQPALAPRRATARPGENGDVMSGVPSRVPRKPPTASTPAAW